MISNISVLFVLKRWYIYYYIVWVAVPLIFEKHSTFFSSDWTNFFCFFVIMYIPSDVFISAYFKVQLLFWPVSILYFTSIGCRKGILAWNGLNSCLLTAYRILCVMLDLHIPKITACLIERVVLFLCSFSFPIHSIWKTSVPELSSTCQKQCQYFDKRDVLRSLTCYIYNGAFCDNSLRLDPTYSYYHKELRRRLSRMPKVYFFR